MSRRSVANRWRFLANMRRERSTENPTPTPSLQPFLLSSINPSSLTSKEPLDPCLPRLPVFVFLCFPFLPLISNPNQEIFGSYISLNAILFIPLSYFFPLILSSLSLRLVICWMDSGIMNGGASSDDILREIERLEVEKKEIENRILLLQAQLNNKTSPDASRKEDDTASCPRPPASSFRHGEVSGEGLSADMIYRYSRHLLLPDFGVEGQLKLLKSSILVVGAGGLGSPVALYLASCGVGIFF